MNALKYLFCRNMTPDNNLENDIINSVITFHETVKVIRRLKLKKAVGVDVIPNEVIKSPTPGSNHVKLVYVLDIHASYCATCFNRMTV